MIIHHHLGLGDHFVCNGLVNILAKEYDHIDLICKSHNYPTVSYLYSENKNVCVIPLDIDNEKQCVQSYALATGQRTIEIGFEHCTLKNWDKSFYTQLNVDFVERYRSFKLPQQKPNTTLKTPSSQFILIHNSSSEQSYNLNIQNNSLQHIFIEKKINLFDYLDLIYNATEIHCIDSSVFHLVDSIPQTTKYLYFHNIRKTPTSFQISPKWEIVNYDN